MKFFTSQSRAFWDELDRDGIVRSRSAFLLAKLEGWSAGQQVLVPDGTVRQVLTPPEVKLRAYSIVKDIYRSQYPSEEFEELIWGYGVSHPTPRERRFDLPQGTPALVLSKYWWNTVFQLVRDEVLKELPMGHYIAPMSKAYDLDPPSTYHALLSQLDQLDSTALCEPSQRLSYVRDGRAVQEIVVPYLSRDWQIDP